MSSSLISTLVSHSHCSLASADVIKQLLEIVLYQEKYSFTAIELFCCDVSQFFDALLTESAANQLLDYVNNEKIDALHASYFAKLAMMLLDKDPQQFVPRIIAFPGIIDSILKNIHFAPIAEFLLKIVSIDEIAEDVQVVNWLAQNRLAQRLVEKLDPRIEADTHSTISQTILDLIAISYQNIVPADQMAQPGNTEQLAESVACFGGNTLTDQLKGQELCSQLIKYMLDTEAPNHASSLSHGVNIIIELVRRYCAEIEQLEFYCHQVEVLSAQGRPVDPVKDSKFYSVSVDLWEILLEIQQSIKHFVPMLQLSPSPSQEESASIPTTMGPMKPLTSHRLKVCELLAEFLHLLYLYTSSPLFPRFGDAAALDVALFESERLVKRKHPQGDNVNGLVLIAKELVAHHVLSVCVSLFFEFQWNNFLHSIVYDMLAKVFNTYSYTHALSIESPASVDDRMRAVMEVSKDLIIDVFTQGQLMQRIMNAQRENDADVERPKGIRRGYMGHITYISDEIVKLLSVADFITYNEEEWNAYTETLKQTKEQDSKVLGGVRPNSDFAVDSMGISSHAYGIDNIATEGLPLSAPPAAANPAMGNAIGNASNSGNSNNPSSNNNNNSNLLAQEPYDEKFDRYLVQCLVRDLPTSVPYFEPDEQQEEVTDFDVNEAIASDVFGMSQVRESLEEDNAQ